MFKENINWKKINVIEFYGMRRSGNHAILSWFMNNLNTEGRSGKDPEILIAPYPELGFISQRVGNVYHINDCASSWAVNNPAYIRGLMEAYISVGAKTIILSYEDTSPTHSIGNENYYPEIFPMLKGAPKMIALRNLEGMLASRIKATNDADKPGINFEITEYTIVNYINQVFHPNATKVHFESWCNSKEYRDLVMYNIKLPNIDYTSHVSKAGGGSSYSGGDPSKRKLEGVPRPTRQILEKYKEHLDKAKNLIDTYISAKS